MKKLFLTLLVATGCLSAAQARNWYVSSGVDSNGNPNGTPVGINGPNRGDFTTPFLTIQYASDLTTAGDVVYIRKGTHKGEFSTSKVLYITNPARSGRDGLPILYRDYPADGEWPVLKFSSDNCIKIEGPVSYLSFFHLRIQGNNGAFDSDKSNGVQVNLAEVDLARQQAGSCFTNGVGTPPNKYNGNGISTEATASGGPHHLRIIENEVFECGGAGIGIGGGDYITIERNTVHDNSWYTVYGTSGITVNSSRNFLANDPNTAYRYVINRNTVYNNRLYVEWYLKNGTNPCRGYTDGNGIIIDVNNPTTTTGYTGKTLISNNLVVNNGGSGIQVLKSNKVDVIHNTVYQNLRSDILKNRSSNSEINNNQSNDMTVQNNIVSTNSISSSTGTLATRAYTGSPTFVKNLFYNPNGNGGFTPPAGTLTANPQFINPTTNIAASNFQLRATATTTIPRSPAINVGGALSSNFTNATSGLDKDGNPRVVGALPDLGAIEVQTAAARTALATSGSASTTSQLDAFPNPFSGSATLAYTLDRPGPVRLEVLDMLGRRVALLVNETQEAGRHEARFEAPGQAAALYQVRLTTAGGTTARKLSGQP